MLVLDEYFKKEMEILESECNVKWLIVQHHL